MSAGGLSYSGLVNYGVATLPSVDSWGTDMNILRDPPKSITTRKIDFVGQDSSITEMIDQSGNRACEAIQVYARGVNPMVSVSYNNYGNNGGQGQAGSLTGLGVLNSGTLGVGGDGITLGTAGAVGGNTYASLPYKIMSGGAFRPPVKTQAELLPLSRLPRVWTEAYTQPGFVDFSRKLRGPIIAECAKEIQHPIKASIRPTAVYKINKPIHPDIKVEYVIQNPIKIQGVSGMRTMDITNQVVKKPQAPIIDENMHVIANSNLVDARQYIQNNNLMDTSKYIQDNTNPQNVFSNLSSNVHSTSIEDILDMPQMPIKDITTINHTASCSGNEKIDYIHKNIELDRSLPEYNITSNVSNNNMRITNQHEYQMELGRNIPSTSFTSNIGGMGDINNSRSTVKTLKPTISGSNMESFEGRGGIPSIQRQQQPTISESQKARTSRIVMDSMQGRFSQQAPFA